MTHELSVRSKGVTPIVYVQNMKSLLDHDLPWIGWRDRNLSMLADHIAHAALRMLFGSARFLTELLGTIFGIEDDL